MSEINFSFGGFELTSMSFWSVNRILVPLKTESWRGIETSCHGQKTNIQTQKTTMASHVDKHVNLTITPQQRFLRRAGNNAIKTTVIRVPYCNMHKQTGKTGRLTFGFSICYFRPEQLLLPGRTTIHMFPVVKPLAEQHNKSCNSIIC